MSLNNNCFGSRVD